MRIRPECTQSVGVPPRNPASTEGYEKKVGKAVNQPKGGWDLYNFYALIHYDRIADSNIEAKCTSRISSNIRNKSRSMMLN